MALRLSHRTGLVLAALGVASILTAAVSIGAQAPEPATTAAQARQFGPIEPLAEPVVLSGSDVGFRIEGSVNGVPAGRLVIRSRSGEWVEPRMVGRGGVIPLTVD